MNNSGWKADTGHKCGYMTYIEKELAKRFPNANIKADPHIQSEVKKLKKISGFGWDDERKMVVGDLELFNGWAKAKGPGDDIDLQEEQSADNMTEPSHQSDSVIDSQSHLQCPGSNPSNGNKSSAKSLKNLVEVQTSNAAAMNVIQYAYAHELEAQSKLIKGGSNCFLSSLNSLSLPVINLSRLLS
ncbi:hypothetical protein HU200_034531 [Digitaria exilis]|uniref:Myb/SANT-like domain-containing protein n=1 Tax=Digitaria exilis TaxID=1010633 RepID=A0A835ENR6_9POAL|nr:hypothetical protein HU200_034531 [Digitaria exilis]